MMDFSEKRDFIRMPMQCPIWIRDMDGDRPETAEMRDLSATGIRFVSARALDTGARLQLTVQPTNPITPPLAAEISVLRCQEIDSGFDIAASIDVVEPVEYIDIA